MWHEARKQEKKIRGVMIDFQRRAERRREHYERTRGDPNQLLRVYGAQCKLHLDPTGGERDSTMIPWQGDPDNLISRYDVRIHMDLIPDYSKLPELELSREEEVEEARCNYERYRALVLNAFKNVADSDALAKIDVDEMYPTTTTSKDKKSKLKSQAKAAIAFKYDDSSGGGGANNHQQDREEEGEDEEDKELSSESEFEMDMDVDLLFSAQVDKLNLLALSYGISTGTFCDNLRVEKEQLGEQKLARLADLEKSNFSGKKARRERRLLKEKRVVTNRQPTPPSYASRSSPTYEPFGPDEEERESISHSRSPSPVVGKVEYITEFGTEEPPPPLVPIPPAPQSSTKSLQSRGGEKRLSPQVESRRRKQGSPHSSGSSRNARPKRSCSPDRRHHRSSSWRRLERSRTRSRSREIRRRRSRSDSSDHRGRRRMERRSRSSSHNGATRSSRDHTSSRGGGRRSSSRDHTSSRGGGRRSSSRDHTSSRGGGRGSSGGRRGSPSTSPSPSPRRRSNSSSSSPKPHRQLSPSPPVPQRTQRSPSLSEEVGGAKVAEDNSEHLSPEDSEVPAEEERRATPPDKPKGPVVAVKAKEKDKTKLTPQEKLKKRMQAQLNKQYKTDKKQQREKEHQKEAERMEREEEMREQTRKIKERDPYGETRHSISRSPSPRHNYGS